MSKRKYPWKRCFRKIPQSVMAKIADYDGKPLKVAAVKIVPCEHIAAGYLLSVGVFYDESGALVVPSEPVLPGADGNLWARRNIEGWVITRKDLPKKPKTFWLDVPNFGDSTLGTHEISYSRECYQREVVSPLDAFISITHKGPSPERDGEILAFELLYTLDQHEVDFERQLLMSLNILQEALGCSDVFPADVDLEEVQKQQHVHWEIFPDGMTDRELGECLARSRVSEQGARIAYERKTLLDSMNPECIIWGSNLGSSVYFGAKFNDNLVVFENVRTGNAIYIMGGNWEELSKLSRSELLRNYNGYDRIIHREGWEDKVRRKINHYLKHGWE